MSPQKALSPIKLNRRWNCDMCQWWTSNTYESIDVTDDGIAIYVRELQFWKAKYSMNFKEDGIENFTCLSDLQQ